MQLTQTVETIPELEPALKANAQMVLANFAIAQRELEYAKEVYETCKGDVQRVYEASGEKTMQVDGCSVTMVTSNTTKLDEKALLRQGVQLSVIEAAKVTKPGTPYLRVTLPKMR